MAGESSTRAPQQRVVQWSLLSGLGAWALWITVESAHQYTFSLSQWIAAWDRVDWASLVPSWRATGSSLARLAAALTILFSAASLGAPIFRRLWPMASQNGVLTRTERFWLSVTCGFGAHTLLLFAVASVRLLYMPVLWGLVGVPILLGGRHLLRFVGPRKSNTPSGSRGLRVLFWAICTIIGATALAPTVLPDSHVYHLVLPSTYLEHHAFVQLPHLLYAQVPHSVELLWTLGLTMGGVPTVNLMHVVMGVGMLYMGIELGRRLRTPTVALLAALVTATALPFLHQWASSYVDIASGFALTVCVWSILYWIEHDDVHVLTIAGLALGWYGSMRYTSLYGVVAVTVVVIGHLLRTKAPIRRWFSIALPFVLGLCIFCIPWFVKNMITVGNPVFPMFTDIFGLGPMRPTDPERYGVLYTFFGRGTAPLDVLLIPWRLTVDQASQHSGLYPAPPFWLIGLPFAVLWPSRDPRMRSLLLLCSAFFIVMAYSTQVFRYLIPIFFFLSLITLDAIRRVIAPVSAHASPLVRRAALGVAVIATSAWWAPGVLWRIVDIPFRYGSVIWGQQDEPSWVHNADEMGPAFAYMDAELPPDATVLFLFENRMYRSPRTAVGDSIPWVPSWFFRIGEAHDSEALAVELRAEGITHVLLNRRAAMTPLWQPMALSPEDGMALTAQRDRILAFVDDACSPLHDVGGYYLYAL